MSNTSNKGTKNAKKNANSNSELMVTDFGSRKILSQNFSHLVTIDRTALTNLGNPTRVNVSLVQQDGEKFLKLIPLAEKKKGVVSN